MNLGAVAILVACFATSLARADESPEVPPADDAAAAAPPPPAPASEAAPPTPARPPPRDIVHLKDGGVVRGTIIELTPGYPVIIQLPTGELRWIPWAHTTYAGADKEARPREPWARRSLGLMTAGIVATATSPLGLLVASIAWGDQRQCEFQRDAAVAAEKTYHCDNSGAVVGGLVATIVLAGVGIPLIFYGAKRVPLDNEKETALRFVPWSRGTTAAGGSLQIGF